MIVPFRMVMLMLSKVVDGGAMMWDAWCAPKCLLSCSAALSIICQKYIIKGVMAEAVKG